MTRSWQWGAVHGNRGLWGMPGDGTAVQGSWPLPEVTFSPALALVSLQVPHPEVPGLSAAVLWALLEGLCSYPRLAVQLRTSLCS